MASTRQIDFQSNINGETYRIQAFVPRQPPPTKGYPAIFVLDGNALFGTFAEAVRNRSLAGEVEPAIVVGISAGEGPSGADHTFDFTTTDMTPREKTLIQDLGPNPKFGGGEGFLQVIREEIAPKVAAIAHVNSRRTALFGWSLGGLFVIKTRFSHPNTFATYLSLSPSLWRSDRALFAEIPDFESRFSISGRRPRLFIAVGSREDEPPSPMFANERMRQQLFAETRYALMVENAVDMAHLLQGFYQKRHRALMSRVFLGDTHNSVPWSAIDPILDFAFLTHDTSAQVH